MSAIRAAALFDEWCVMCDVSCAECDMTWSGLICLQVLERDRASQNMLLIFLLVCFHLTASPPWLPEYPKYTTWHDMTPAACFDVDDSKRVKDKIRTP